MITHSFDEKGNIILNKDKKTLGIFATSTASKKLYFEYRIKTTNTFNTVITEPVRGRRTWFHDKQSVIPVIEAEKHLENVMLPELTNDKALPIEIKVNMAWRKSGLQIPASGASYDHEIIISDILKNSAYTELTSIEKHSDALAVITWNANLMVNSLRKKLYKGNMKPVDSEYPINEYIAVWCNWDHILDMKFSGKTWQELDPLIVAINRFNTEEERVAATNVTV